MSRAAAIYTRISRDDRGDQLGVMRQEEDCRALAEQKGWPVVQVFRDDDQSAFIPGKRPQYRELLEAIRVHEVDAVLVYDLDRLHRHPWELEEFFRVADEAGITQMASVSGDLDLSSNDDRCMARIMGAVAKKSSDDLARRIRRKKDELAERGLPAGGGSRRCFGYAEDRKTVIEHEAEMIREATQEIISGVSLSSICRRWNDAERFTALGATWRVGALRGLLINPRITGLRVHRGQVVARAVWRPILDRATFDRVNSILTDPRRAVERPVRRYCLGGLVHCGLCKAKLSTRKMGGRRYYHCTKSPGTPGCGHLGVVAEPLEEFVIEMVFIRLDSPALADALNRNDDEAEEEQQARSDVSLLEDRQTELAREYGHGGIQMHEWLEAKKAIESKLEVARRLLAKHQRKTALDEYSNLHVLREAWPGLGIDRRRAILGAIIERVNVAPAERGANKFDSRRVGVIWRA